MMMMMMKRLALALGERTGTVVLGLQLFFVLVSKIVDGMKKGTKVQQDVSM
jgi:hypothetical protein